MFPAASADAYATADAIFVSTLVKITDGDLNK